MQAVGKSRFWDWVEVLVIPVYVYQKWSEMFGHVVMLSKWLS